MAAIGWGYAADADFMKPTTLRPTPTANSHLELRLATFDTLSEGLDYAARGETGCNFFSGRGQLESVLTYADLREKSRSMALRLSGLGLTRGSRVGVIAATSPDFLIFFYGCQYAGLIPVPLPISTNLGGRQAYVERLRAMLLAADVSSAVAGPDMIEMLREAAVGVNVGLVGTPARFLGSQREQGRSAALGQGRPGLHPILLRKHQHAAGRDGDAARHYQQRARHRASWPRARSRRPLRLLAAALPRHGFGRLFDHAHAWPVLGRLPSDVRLHQAPASVAADHL